MLSLILITSIECSAQMNPFARQKPSTSVRVLVFIDCFVSVFPSCFGHLKSRFGALLCSVLRRNFFYL